VGRRRLPRLSRRHGVRRAIERELDRRAGGGRFVLQTSNPKALVFFVALLPQFIDARGPVAWQVLVLGVTSVVIEFVVLLAYGAAAGRATRLAARPRLRTLADRVAGSLLIGAGIGIARMRQA
jgi:homoserine/homoserine lactone efflux protein